MVHGTRAWGVERKATAVLRGSATCVRRSLEADPSSVSLSFDPQHRSDHCSDYTLHRLVSLSCENLWLHRKHWTRFRLIAACTQVIIRLFACFLFNFSHIFLFSFSLLAALRFYQTLVLGECNILLGSYEACFLTQQRYFRLKSCCFFSGNHPQPSLCHVTLTSTWNI